MDQLHKNLPPYCQSVQHLPNHRSLTDNFQQPPISNQFHSDSRPQEPKECNTARKVQKADREKLRRDRLNEQFTELGNTLDPERPKNDKASILSDTVQVLNDLTTQVNRLKSEYAALTEESRELTQEKNDLREEKAALKSDIESLNLQYQQRLRAMYPWGGMDPSVVMHPHPPSYPYPMPMAIPPGSIPMHPSLHPYPFFGNQNPAVVSNPCPTFVPYIAPNTLIEQQSVQYASPTVQPISRSNTSNKPSSRNKSSDQGGSNRREDEDSNDVGTELELKTPGSAGEQDCSRGHMKSRKIQRKENSIPDGSSSSRCSSSPTVDASSSVSVVGGMKADS